MKKTATASPAPESREEMEEIVRDICKLQLDAASLSIDMEQEITCVRARYEGRITHAQERSKELLKLAEEWALANPLEFAGKKTVVMVHGVVGYRTGMPKLKTLRGWTWDRVLDILVKFWPDLVRTKNEPAKDLILMRRDEIGPERLRRMGLQVIQEESFFVEPHREQVPS